MADLSKQIAIKMALNWAVTGLKKLVELLEEMNEDDVADKVEDIRRQLVRAVKGKDDGRA